MSASASSFSVNAFKAWNPSFDSGRGGAGHGLPFPNHSTTSEEDYE